MFISLTPAPSWAAGWMLPHTEENIHQKCCQHKPMNGLWMENQSDTVMCSRVAKCGAVSGPQFARCSGCCDRVIRKCVEWHKELECWTLARPPPTRQIPSAEGGQAHCWQPGTGLISHYTLYVQTVYGKRGDLSIIVQKIAGNWWQIVSACVRWPDNSAPCIHSPALDISCHTQQHAHCGATCPVAGIWNNVNI